MNPGEETTFLTDSLIQCLTPQKAIILIKPMKVDVIVLVGHFKRIWSAILIIFQQQIFKLIQTDEMIVQAWHKDHFG
jgi:hypothetical protein